MNPIDVLKEQTKEFEDNNELRKLLGYPPVPVVKIPIPKERETK